MNWISRSWRFVKDPNHSGAVVAIFTIVIASTGIVYTIFAALQWTVMREAFIAANKPAVGVNGISVGHYDTSGKLLENRGLPGAASMVFTIEVKNFGSVSAENFLPDWKVFIDGIEQPNPNPEGRKPGTIFPQKSVFFRGQIGGPDYVAIMTGKEILETEVSVKYEGLGRNYNYCERQRYGPQIDYFFRFGASCLK
jgi:hypothetical protein